MNTAELRNIGIELARTGNAVAGAKVVAASDTIYKLRLCLQSVKSLLEHSQQTGVLDAPKCLGKIDNALSK